MALTLPADYALLEAMLPRPGIGKHLAAVATHVAGGEGESADYFLAQSNFVLVALATLLGVVRREGRAAR